MVSASTGILVMQGWNSTRKESGVRAESLRLAKGTFLAGEKSMGWTKGVNHLSSRAIENCSCLDSSFVLKFLRLQGCGCVDVSLGYICQIEGKWSPNGCVSKLEFLYQNMYHIFDTRRRCIENIGVMYQNILIHRHFLYTAVRVSKKWYILYRVSTNVSVFWYTIQYVSKKWYTKLYTEV